MPTSIITTSILSLLCAIRGVESCDGLDRAANGNDYQITSVCVHDVNRLYGTHYVWPNCTTDRETAENIVVLYLGYYGMKYFQDYRRVPTREVLAKIYHCGWTGFKRGDPRGAKYWKKVNAKMKR